MEQEDNFATIYAMLSLAPDEIKIGIFSELPYDDRIILCQALEKDSNSPCRLASSSQWQSLLIKRYRQREDEDPKVTVERIKNLLLSNGYRYYPRDWYTNFESLEDLDRKKSNKTYQLLVVAINRKSSSSSLYSDDLDLYMSKLRLPFLPPELGKLTRLDYISITGNRHLRVMPPNLGNLINLKTLNLSDNGLVILPESIGQLKLLNKLNVRGNKLISLPNSIGNSLILRGLISNTTSLSVYLTRSVVSPLSRLLFSTRTNLFPSLTRSVVLPLSRVLFSTRTS
jgi:hypothetical protein